MNGILEDLRKKKAQLKTQRALAEWLSVRESYVSNLLTGTVPMTTTIAAKLGWEKVETWRRIKTPSHAKHPGATKPAPRA